MTTLTEHLEAELAGRGAEGKDLAAIVTAFARAARRLSAEIRRAALEGALGYMGGRNVTGDAQKKLDVIGNETVLSALGDVPAVAAAVSEELDDPHPLGGAAGRYVVCTDPLDGSSNTDINGAVGTIFGVHRRASSGPLDPARDVLRPGSDQVLAGYVLYGPATLLVYTAGRGAHGFTLDLEADRFVRTHAEIRCPSRGSAYSANTARLHDWEPGVQRFVERLTRPEPDADGAGGKAKPYSLRYTGALVADLHRCLVEGGVYFYPDDPKNRDGKLRLLYECAPLAFVVEQAGGKASTGRERILDVPAGSLHQRVPFVIGGAEEVELYERCLTTGSPRSET